MLRAHIFRFSNNKVGDVGVHFTTSIASSLSRLIVRLIFRFMAVHDSLFALNCSCKRVGARVKRDRRISSDRDKTFLFTFMLPLAMTIECAYYCFSHSPRISRMEPEIVESNGGGVGVSSFPSPLFGPQKMR